MTDKNKTGIISNKCFVFSETTLEIATQEWLEINSESSPKKEDNFKIAIAALPWLLKHLNQSGSIMMFSYEDLVSEISEWKSIQIEAYPKQKQRINETCSLILEFFQSEVVEKNKMAIEA